MGHLESFKNLKMEGVEMVVDGKTKISPSYTWSHHHTFT